MLYSPILKVQQIYNEHSPSNDVQACLAYSFYKKYKIYFYVTFQLPWAVQTATKISCTLTADWRNSFCNFIKPNILFSLSKKKLCPSYNILDFPLFRPLYTVSSFSHCDKYGLPLKATLSSLWLEKQQHCFDYCFIVSTKVQYSIQ